MNLKRERRVYLVPGKSKKHVKKNIRKFICGNKRKLQMLGIFRIFLKMVLDPL